MQAMGPQKENALSDQVRATEDSIRIIALVFTLLVVFIGIEQFSVVLQFDPLEGREWQFRQDMNRDGRLTISDVWANVHWLFFYPGDLLIYFVHHHLLWFSRTMGAVTAFFEISPVWYGGFVSFVVSLILWPSVWFSVYGAFYWVLWKPGDLYGRYLGRKSGKKP